MYYPQNLARPPRRTPERLRRFLVALGVLFGLGAGGCSGGEDAPVSVVVGTVSDSPLGAATAIPDGPASLAAGASSGAQVAPVQSAVANVPVAVNPAPPAVVPAVTPRPVVVAEPQEQLILGEPEPEPEPEEPKGDCGSAVVEAKLVREPVDIILVVDNSGSMVNEILAVQRNINVNFANILQDADMDYRVLLIARHGSATESNYICVEQPLSGVASCDPPPPEPAFTDRFVQYNMKIDSNDSFWKLLGAYRAPFADTIFRDKLRIAEMGWHVYLRPDARKVFLILTDDDAEGVSWEEFDRELMALAPEHFGTEQERTYTWHSIVGMEAKPNPAEAWLPEDPIQTGLCGVSEDVEEPGTPYQHLSKLTGGLRFPLCQTDAYDVVFQRIASDVITHSELSCDFPLPPAPRGKTLDLTKVGVAYTATEGAAPQTFGQAPNVESCQPNAFYIANDHISLCPDTCAALKDNPSALIDVLFTCESTLLPIVVQ